MNFFAASAINGSSFSGFAATTDTPASKQGQVRAPRATRRPKPPALGGATAAASNPPVAPALFDQYSEQKLPTAPGDSSSISFVINDMTHDIDLLRARIADERRAAGSKGAVGTKHLLDGMGAPVADLDRTLKLLRSLVRALEARK
jgi:hypothetical protein